MIGKDTLTYGEMKRQPDKPRFITEMQNEISEHKQRKHWKLVHRSETKGPLVDRYFWSSKCLNALVGNFGDLSTPRLLLFVL